MTAFALDTSNRGSLLTYTNADWLPTLYLGNSKSQQAKINPGETLRMARRIARNARKNEEDAAQSLLLLSVATESGSSDTPALECSMSPDVSEDPECSHGKLLDAATQADGMYDEAAELKEKIDGQAKFIEQLQQTIQNITMKIKATFFFLSRHL